MTAAVKSSTLYVGNLPVDATRTEVEEVFGEAGPIKKCFVLKAKDALSAYAFVTYALPEDTDTAAAELKDANIRGNALNVSVSNRKHKSKQRATEAQGPEKHKSKQSAAEAQGPEKHKSKQRAAEGQGPEKHKSKQSAAEGQDPEKTARSEARPGPPQKKRKTADGAVVNATGHSAPRNKKGRLIVRNLSFKVTEEKLRKHFSDVGPITEVTLLKKPDGRLVGCGFVQFKLENHAEQAIKKFNTKPFLGRPIVIDWAVEKARYEAAKKPADDGDKRQKRPAEDDDEESDGEGDDDSSPDSGQRAAVAKATRHGTSDGESEDSASEVEDEKSAEMSAEEGEGSEEGEGEESEDEASEDDEEESEEDDEEESEDGESDGESEDSGDEVEEEPVAKKPAAKRKDGVSDVSAGATLFIKNLSFDTDQETLKELFSQYGRVKYALICIDPLTEHPRGTAFVQFKTAEEAAAALAAGQDPQNALQFTLDDRRIEVLPAVDKREISQRKQAAKDKANEGKDKRNLYLAREGLVREGSRAAQGVSRADLNKRVGLEKWKAKMLKNLNMMVSRTRLCVHNLPETVDDARLREVFRQHAPQAARITEARVMRDRKDISTHPRGRSKEYGFVNFTEHEASLAALRNINNNPEIFTNNRRPIVEFAVESRAALDARKKRELKSRQMNTASGGGTAAGRGRGRSRVSAASSGAEPARPAHAGMAADPANKTLPKLKSRAGAQESARAIRRKMLKTDKRGRSRRERAGHKKDLVQDWEQRPAEKKKPSRREKKKAERSQKKQQQQDHFSSLVDKYRQKLAAGGAW